MATHLRMLNEEYYALKACKYISEEVTQHPQEEFFEISQHSVGRINAIFTLSGFDRMRCSEFLIKCVSDLHERYLFSFIQANNGKILRISCVLQRAEEIKQ